MEQESKGNKALIWVVVAVLVVAVGAFLFFANVDEDEDEPTDQQDTEQVVDEEEAPVGPTENIVEIAAADQNFSTLVAAIQAADLVETLSGEGPFTVFAPTDAAFDAALDELGITAEELLARDDLADILTYHVIVGEFLAADVAELDGQEVETVNGQTVTITVTDDGVLVNDVLVTTTDIQATNGVIHVIDGVLLPAEE
jgi:transforming growth factor-beta-induced protein